MRYKNFACLFILLTTAFCVSTPPHKDYALAKSALSIAKKFSADKVAPKYYSKSLILYKKAVTSYNQKDYEKAGLLFEDSIRYAEKAELKARIIQKNEQDME